jgi:hypothetical protein
MVLPQLSQAEEDRSHDYKTILNQLTRVYDNLNKVQEAEDKLYALKQGTDSLHAYMAKFERTLYEARGQDWPDVNKISTFRNGLNSTLRNRLAQQLNLPRKYSDFVRIIQQLAGRSSGSSSSVPPPYASSSGNGHSNGHYHSEPMDLNIVTMDSIRSTGKTTIVALDDDAYDNDNIWEGMEEPMDPESEARLAKFWA